MLICLTCLLCDKWQQDFLATSFEPNSSVVEPLNNLPDEFHTVFERLISESCFLLSI